MTPSMVLSLALGLVGLIGGGAHVLLGPRLAPAGQRIFRRAVALPVAAGLVGALAWALAGPPELPAASAALLLLGMGALLALAFLVEGRASGAHGAAWGLTLMGVGAAGAAAALMAWSGADAAEAVPGHAIFVARLVLGGLGAGAWLPTALASGLFAARPQPEVVTRGDLPAAGRPVDPGRLAALPGYPVLTAALLAAVIWNVLAFASAWRTSLPDLWLLVTWLLGAAYLHATSPWRPLGLPAWFPSLLAGGACGSAVLSALSAGALLVG